jgi:hypothetical protein
MFLILFLFTVCQFSFSLDEMGRSMYLIWSDAFGGSLVLDGPACVVSVCTWGGYGGNCCDRGVGVLAFESGGGTLTWVSMAENLGINLDRNVLKV